ncbi:fumarylacetoacetase [Altererythrobacter atlanticus]|uniref:fumarylacetoacetase n=1 Tax=Croceibacterium atlanticum TaxID=1267766 RepID=A0A0F7KQX6_9SPHN|nr:fumarylacetoacetate hydrolase family protein [Croceibacterium atlanticum]AKH42888.1 Fumarylacetoacetate (FAA) hydrolase family protein [Croceibacterium atlanticum]MBB5731668.1 fumarylacetoacetase [Croceibacterium atlanticum]
MPIELNATHDPQRRSFVASANEEGADFPIQNLPFGVFDDGRGARGGVALGDSIIDLAALLRSGALSGAAADAAMAASKDGLEDLFLIKPDQLSSLRRALSDLYAAGSADRAKAEEALVPAASATMHMPARPAAFTDFCTSADHILRMARNGGREPQPAWMTLPVAYNGRASSVAVSGTPVIRPRGQVAPRGGTGPEFMAEPMLDFEVEFGAWLRGPGNPLGETVSMQKAEELLFGCCLVNDWSARGIQFYEMILGPHLGKSFLTTISPWIVTMEALAPFRVPGRGRTEEEPALLEYLDDPEDRRSGGLNIELTAELDTGSGPHRIVRTNVAELFWTLAQMVAHQACGGAPLENADLIATGTVSGAADEARACLVEITELGKKPLILPDGTQRVMLEDGDTLAIRGRALADGFVPIGFGECSGTISRARNP